MNKEKVSSRPKDKNYHSFEELKSKLFPDLVIQEEQEQGKQDHRLLGVDWANESIDNVLSKTQ